MPVAYDRIVGSVGLELEAEIPVPRTWAAKNWASTHDASMELPVIVTGNCSEFIIPKTPDNIRWTHMFNSDGGVIGDEFVSKVFIELSEMEEGVYAQIQKLQTCGETLENERAGLHVHVGWAYDLEILKRTIQVAGWLESLMFHLGGMGYKYRGVNNYACYSRPFTAYGPPVVHANIGWVQMTNIESLLSSSSVNSFWNRYGGVDMFNPPKRYTPQRYMGFNLFSVFLHPTLEFRMFNTCLNPEFIIAVTALCREIARLTMNPLVKIPDKISSVYDVSKRDKNHDVLDELLGLIKLSKDNEESLREILERSPVPLLKKVYATSHLDNPIGFDMEDLFKVNSLYPKIDDYKKVKALDSHYLDAKLGEALRRIQLNDEKELERIRLDLNLNAMRQNLEELGDKNNRLRELLEEAGDVFNEMGEDELEDELDENPGEEV